jgi:ABC-type polysaccharide/polyol phosphate export permease
MNAPLQRTEFCSSVPTGWLDFLNSFGHWRVFLLLGWQKTKSSYQRTLLGPFWITINKAIHIAALGLVFGVILGAPRGDYIPHLAIGLIGWALITGVLNQACVAFSGSAGLIKQVPLPLHVHLLQVYWQNLIVYAHNLAIVPGLWWIYGTFPNGEVLWLIPGTLVVLLNVSWMGLLLALGCARFRDLQQIIVNLLQIAFFLTPIMWMPEMLSDNLGPLLLDWSTWSQGHLDWPSTRIEWIDLNPFHHLVNLIRTPLEGGTVSADHWGITLSFAALGWGVALMVYQRKWRQIVYWL